MNKYVVQLVVKSVALVILFAPVVFIYNFGILLGLAWSIAFGFTTLATLTFLLRNNKFIRGETL